MYHASDMCATTGMMEVIVDVFVLGVGVASTRQRGVEDAGWGRQAALRSLHARPGRRRPMRERPLTSLRDGVDRNGLYSRSEAYRPRRALADRVHQLQKSYDVHDCQSGQCTLPLSRNGFPMPLAKEDEGLLASWLANQSQIRTAAVVAQCW